jgi:hypothetical protein
LEGDRDPRFARQHALGPRASECLFETTWITVRDAKAPDPARCCTNCNPLLASRFQPVLFSREQRARFDDAFELRVPRAAVPTLASLKDELRQRLFSLRERLWLARPSYDQLTTREWILATTSIDRMCNFAGRLRGDFAVDGNEVAGVLLDKHGIRPAVMEQVVREITEWRDGEVARGDAKKVAAEAVREEEKQQAKKAKKAKEDAVFDKAGVRRGGKLTTFRKTVVVSPPKAAKAPPEGRTGTRAASRHAKQNTICV